MRFVSKPIAALALREDGGVVFGSVVFGWRALRPPRVVFVPGFVSLINSLIWGKNCHRVVRTPFIGALGGAVGFVFIT